MEMHMNVLVQDNLGMVTYSMVKNIVIQDSLVYLFFTDGEDRSVEGKVLEVWLEEENT